MFPETYATAWLFHRNTVIGRHQSVSEPPPQVIAPFKEYPAIPLLHLPAAGNLEISLGTVIRKRFSCRQFQDFPLPLPDLATILHTSYGIQDRVLLGEHELLTRPVPSGGGLYPLELYILVRQVENLDPGIYHYAVLHHGLERLEQAPLSDAYLSELFLGQTYVANAALIVVVTAVLARSLGKYADRGYRLILLEAGHVLQNLNLAVGALTWGSVNLGGFLDLELGTVLDLNADLEVPIYAVAVGKPQQTDTASLRQP